MSPEARSRSMAAGSSLCFDLDRSIRLTIARASNIPFISLSEFANRFVLGLQGPAGVQPC
jgi:hypothetical protein